ncbi:hypothetical protein BsWGS_17909 [Bradybaena similaris]
MGLKRCLAVLITAVLMLNELQTSHAEVLSSSDEAKLVGLLKNVLECRQIPGLTMTLVKGKEHRVFPLGVSNKETGDAVTPRTLFYLGTITQAFTATLLAQLTQRSEGSVQFDVPITQLIGPELQLSSELLAQTVTLRDALMHRTGLSTGSIGGMTGLPQAMSRSQVISNLKEIPMQADFRDDFRFNQFTMTLAAYVGEKVTSSTWEKLMRVHLLDKLLMTDTTVATDDRSSPDFSRSYVSVSGLLVEADPKVLDIGPLAPAATMFTNAEDMVKALKFFLGDPMLLSQARMPAPLLEELMVPRILLPITYRASVDRSSYIWPVPDISVGYGMGFFRNVYRGFQVPWAGSTTHGFSSLMWLIPERGVGVFISINGQKHSEMPLATLQSIMYYATDLMLGFEPWINETTACSFPEPWMKIPEFPEMDFKPEQPDFALTEYQGSFTNPLLGGLTIGKSPSNSKALTFKMSEVTGELLPEGGNVFRLFVDGSYKHLTTPVHGKKPIPFARLFFDFKGKQCIGLKFPDSIFGGGPVNFVKSKGKEEL